MKRFFSILLFGILVWLSEQYCAPRCEGVDPGTFVRDPTDCTRYYVCLSIGGEMIPSEEPVECPDNQYFNDHLTQPRCQDISLAPSGFCSPLCDPCVADCHPDNPGTVQPHQDCGNYYVCLADGHTLLEECSAPTPYFDFRTGECQADASLCYDYCDPCLPYCTYEGQQVPDPTDCTKFFYCTPPTMAAFTCPHDEVFNSITNRCEVGAPCIVTCPDMTTAAPTTTTVLTTTTTMETTTTGTMETTTTEWITSTIGF